MASPPFARGAKEIADRVIEALDEIREEIAAARKHKHDPRYVEDRLQALAQQETELRRRFQEDVIPRLRRQEAQQAPTIEARLADLEEWRRQLEAGIVQMPKRREVG